MSNNSRIFCITSEGPSTCHKNDLSVIWTLPARASQARIPLLLLVSGVIVFKRLLVVISRYQLRCQHGCGLPQSLTSYDPFGITYALQILNLTSTSSRNTSIRALHELWGPTFVSRYMGRQLFHTSEPKNIQAVLATDFEKWGVHPMRNFAFKPFVGPGIMCVDGDRWARSRAIMKPTFSKTNIADIRIETFGGLVQTMIRALPRNKVVDLQPFFRHLALDSATEFLFGEPLNALTTMSVEAAQFLEAYDYGQIGVAKRMHLPNWNALTRDQRFWKACKIARQFVKGYVDKAAIELVDARNTGREAEKAFHRRCVLVHELLKQTGDCEETLNQLLNVFLPAHEASGVALANLFFNLARHPEVYSRARQEVLKAHKQDTRWTFDRLKNLKYLQKVIKESYRFTPSIGSSTRIALQDTILPAGGLCVGADKHIDVPILVEKGDTIMLSFCALHHRKDIFGPDADQFNPDRWDTLKPAHWSYMAFGGGPRVCIGQQLAMTEVAYTTVQLLLAFEAVDNCDPILEFVEEYKITTGSRNGVKVLLKPAASNLISPVAELF